jgi:Cu/Ag efflux protein CusF
VRRRLAGVLASSVLALTVAAAPASAAGPAAGKPEWHGTGVVLRLLPPPSDLHATRPVIVIQHEAIPGLMEEAMAMPFIAASTALFQGLHAGDHIAFALKETSDALLVVEINRLPPAR